MAATRGPFCSWAVRGHTPFSVSSAYDLPGSKSGRYGHGRRRGARWGTSGDRIDPGALEPEHHGSPSLAGERRGGDLSRVPGRLGLAPQMRPPPPQHGTGTGPLSRATPSRALPPEACWGRGPAVRAARRHRHADAGRAPQQEPTAVVSDVAPHGVRHTGPWLAAGAARRVICRAAAMSCMSLASRRRTLSADARRLEARAGWSGSQQFRARELRRADGQSPTRVLADERLHLQASNLATNSSPAGRTLRRLIPSRGGPAHALGASRT